MKKTIFTFLLSALCGMASAQTLTIPDIQIIPGKTASFSLIVNVGDKVVNGFQFEKLTLPEGLSVTGTGTANSEWDAGAAVMTQGTIGSSTSLAGNLIPQKEIAIATIGLKADESIALGEYEVTIPANDFNFLDGKNYFPVANVVKFKVTVVDRLILDEAKGFVPDPIEADVQVIRTIKANTWSTICLPFTLSKAKAEDAFGSDVQLGEFVGFSTEYADEEDMSPDAIVLKFAKYEMTAKKGMTGGKPFIIKTSKDISKFDVDGVKFVTSVTPSTGKDENDTSGSFEGTFTKTMVPADGLFLNGGNFWYSTGNSETKAFRGWFALGAVLDKDTDFGSRVIINFIDDDITGIKSAKTFNGEEIYTLSGQRVDKAGKGVYIVNGKKVIKK